MSKRSEGKYSGKAADSDEEDFGGGKSDAVDVPVNIEIKSINFKSPEKAPISAPLSVQLIFNLDREVVAGIWTLKVHHNSLFCFCFFH